MRTTTLESMKKAWIPESYWNDDEPAIQSYINSGEINEASKKWDASKTLRFAKVQGKTFDELFVPNGVVMDDFNDIIAQCFKTKAELLAALKKEGIPTSVDYNSAAFGVQGPK